MAQTSSSAMLMKEIYAWQISPEELQIIKLALQGKITKRSPLWDKAQAIAEQIEVDVSFLQADANYGLTKDIKRTLEELGQATVPQIAKHLGVEVNSISSLTSKLYKAKKVKRKTLPKTPRKGRGVQARYVYYLNDSQNL